MSAAQRQSAPRFKRKALFYGCLAAMMSSAVQAETNLEAIVVSGDWLGNGSEEDVRTYPGARDVVSAEELHERGALNLEDALRSTPGLQVLDETGTGILPNIGVRGMNPLRSERVQFLVDGYPIAIGPYTNVGVSLFPVTLPSVDSIDMVRGGAAVHYGPNNLGGVVNLHTRPIPRELEQTVREQITIAEETGHLLNDFYYRIGGAVNEDLALQFQINTQNGDGARDHSDTDVSNFILDALYTPNDQHEIAAQLQYYDVDAELPGALSAQAYRDDITQSQRPYDAYDADMLRGTLTWTYTPTNDVEFQWRNFAHDADRTFFFGQRLGTGDHWADPSLESTHVADSPRLFTVYGTEPRLTVWNGNHKMIFGARYIREEVEFDVNRLELATGAYSNVRDWNFETDAWALYASDTIYMMNDRVELTPGIRYETVRTDYSDGISGFEDDNNVDEVLPGLTLGFHATDNLFLFANTQRSLVPVQTAQVTKPGEVGNETAWNYEIGTRLRASDNLDIGATLFRIEHEDLIQYHRPSDTYQNLGEARSQGLELTSSWQASERLTLEANYTYLDTEQLSGDFKGNELANASRHHLGASAHYRYGPWQASLSGTHVSESYTDAANTNEEAADGSAGRLPAYTLVNTRVSRDLKLGDDKQLQLAVSANNLLDEEYYFRGADVSPIGRIPGQGRSFILSAQLDF
ncbi:Fe(3+) dicitrate transport protein [Marinobacterium mangrovicola]|uniref:Fe(3+) dicitrate transport protein n=2 Tax=Marinobacterium mangrovicola TaxID=1476959 RepID=A0A4R1GSI1_9GAMM|nr:Fe(3+) dicitrate transport protein [Marinobacterium mangrovicola]